MHQSWSGRRILSSKAAKGDTQSSGIDLASAQPQLP